jgi:hypothetical protein
MTATYYLFRLLCPARKTQHISLICTDPVFILSYSKNRNRGSIVSFSLTVMPCWWFPYIWSDTTYSARPWKVQGLFISTFRQYWHKTWHLEVEITKDNGCTKSRLNMTEKKPPVPLHQGLFKWGWPMDYMNRHIHEHNKDESPDHDKMIPSQLESLGVLKWGQHPSIHWWYNW